MKNELKNINLKKKQKKINSKLLNEQLRVYFIAYLKLLYILKFDIRALNFMLIS